MVHSCCAINCTNRAVKKQPLSSSTDNASSSNSCDNVPVRSFHRFPKDEYLQRLWVSAVSRVGFKPTKCSRICSDHFLETDFLKEKKRRLLKQSAVPFGKSLKERRKIIKTPLKKPKKKLKLKKEKIKKEPVTLEQLALKKRIKAFRARIRRRRKKLLVSL